MHKSMAEKLLHSRILHFASSFFVSFRAIIKNIEHARRRKKNKYGPNTQKRHVQFIIYELPCKKKRTLQFCKLLLFFDLALIFAHTNTGSCWNIWSRLDNGFIWVLWVRFYNENVFRIAYKEICTPSTECISAETALSTCRTFVPFMYHGEGWLGDCALLISHFPLLICMNQWNSAIRNKILQLTSKIENFTKK